MKFNDFHIQLATAYPGLKEEGSRKGRTFVGDISTNEGTKLQAYIKLLQVGDLAKEALCAVLARKLHLPMLRPYYVEVDPSFTKGHKQGNIHHVAFGVEKETLPTFRVRGSIEEEVLQWPEVERCAVFDEWIGNNDRYPNNLLFTGNKDFVIFDHDEALPNGLSATDSGNSNLLDLLTKNKQGQEFELHRLLRKAMGFVEGYKKINWDELLELLLPAYVPDIDIEQYLKKYVNLLTERAKFMDVILARRLGIRQIDWISTLEQKKTEEGNKS